MKQCHHFRDRSVHLQTNLLTNMPRSSSQRRKSSAFNRYQPHAIHVFNHCHIHLMLLKSAKMSFYVLCSTLINLAFVPEIINTLITYIIIFLVNVYPLSRGVTCKIITGSHKLSSRTSISPSTNGFIFRSDLWWAHFHLCTFHYNSMSAHFQKCTGMD